jgi:hypothetical protein
MKQTALISTDTGSRLTDLSVLVFSFLVFELLVGSQGWRHTALDLLVYVSVLFISIRLSKRFVFQVLSGQHRCINTIYGNVFGIVVGVTVLLLLDALMPVLSENLLVVVFSSVMAFFVLGTLSPVVKSSHKDIIHH